MASNRSRGRVLTFYSYKGGTGRSMALANLAFILACAGRRVLAIDWDVEAPGLHRYLRPFLIDTELSSSDGLIDMVDEYASQAIRPVEGGAKPEPDWYLEYADFTPYLLSVNFDHFPKGGHIDFLPAGRQGDAYAVKVSSFNWQNLYDRLGGGAFFEAFKARAKDEYDYILIDSRTGVSDTAGICSAQMADCLVVCFTYNNQSVQGAAAVARSALRMRATLATRSCGEAAYAGFPAPGLEDAERPYRVFPVPMRVDAGEIDRLAARQAFAREVFGDLMGHLGPAGVGSYWGAVEVPYQPFYGYEEVLAPFKDDPHNPKSLLAAFLRLCSYVTDGDVTDLRLPIEPEIRQQYLDAFAQVPLGARAARVVKGESEEEALVRKADASLARLNEDERIQAFRALSRLVRLGREEEGSGYFPIFANVSDFSDAERAVLGKLAQDGIVTVGEVRASAQTSRSAGERTVGLADERLLKIWKTLRDRLDGDQEFLLWRQSLRGYLADWERSGRDAGALLSGTMLNMGRLWAHARRDDLNSAELAYLDAARDEVTGAIHVPLTPRAALRRWWPAGVVAVLALAVGVLWFSFSRAAGPNGGGSTTRDVAGAMARIADGDRLVQSGDAEAAVKAYETAGQLDPENVISFLRLGAVLDSLRRFEPALRAYERAARLAPNNPEVFAGRSASAALQGQFVSAIADLDRAIGLDANNPKYYFDRGVAKEGAGETAGAIGDYTRATEINPDFAEAHFNRGRLFEAGGARDKAIADYRAVAASKAADQNTRTTAEARLKILLAGGPGGPQPPRGGEPVRYRVAIQYADRLDERLVTVFSKSLAASLRPVSLLPPQLVPEPTNGDVRYFFREDEAFAQRVKSEAELALAKLGCRVTLRMLFRGRDVMPEVRPGTVEVWLPPLSRAAAAGR